MLLYLSIVLSMLFVLRALNVFQPKLKPAPVRKYRNQEIVDIDFEKVNQQ